MSVRRRVWPGGSSWVVHVKFTTPSGEKINIRDTSPVNTRRGAEEFERQIRSSVLAGTYGRPEAMTFADFIVRYLEDRKAKVRPSTYSAMKGLMRLHLVPAFGHLTLDDITKAKLDEFVTKQLGTHKASTVNNHMRYLGAALGAAAEWGLMKTKPTTSALKVPSPDPSFWSFEETARLVALGDPMVTLALKTGLRIGELCALRWENVQPDRLRVVATVWQGVLGPPKGKLSRDVPLGKTARSTLEHMPRSGPWVFGGQKMPTPGYKRLPIERALRKTKLTGGWHKCRHTFASHLAMKGVPLTVIQSLLGHASLAMTMRYAHLMPGYDAKAVELLE